MSITPLLPLVLALLPQTAADTRPELATAPEEVRRPLLEHDWARAETELERLIAKDDAADDHWLLLQAVARRGAGRLADAEAALLTLEREHATSPWLHKSRFLRADLYRELHRYEEAQRIYEEEARRLRSSERQGELAGIYMEFADALSAAPDPTRPDGGERDLARAAVLYEKVLDLEAPRALRERATYRVAVCQRERQDWTEARRLYQRYLDEFGGERRLGADALRALDVETEGRAFRARFELAECEAAQNQGAQARRRFEDLAELLGRVRTADSGDEVAAERETRLARLQANALHAAAGTYGSSASERRLAIAALRRLLADHADWRAAFRARFEIANHLLSMNSDEDALAAFGEYLASPATSASDPALREEDAENRMRSLFLRGEILRRQRRFQRAIETFGDYVARHATGPDWAAAQQAILECEYAIGALHREEGRHEAARAAWSAFLESHPLDPRARRILFDLAELWAEEAAAREDSDSAETVALWETAIRAWKGVAAKYPGTNEASHALFRAAETLELVLARFEDAIATYRACNFGSHGSAARARLDAMSEESLAVHTERTWRTDETARIRLTTRNVEEVSIELYALDLEAYFRKHLTHRRIEDLDLDLIATDLRVEHAIDGYLRFALLQRDVELPVEGPGVWAVVVRAGEQRATTLVLRSDVEVIVKSSREELFAFAQDMRRDEPAAGVRLLVGAPGPDGRQTVHEVTTDAGGVARLAFPESCASDELHVFAMREGHYAAHGLSIAGLNVPVGLTPRAVAYTDRSAYRPGQEVRWRAILRDVSDGEYAFLQGREYLAEIRDAQGRSLWRERVPVSAFGTLSGSFVLDDVAPLGEYTLTCTHAPNVAATCSFLVEEYRLDKVDLAFDFDRALYFRGEVVRLGVEAAYYYGAPVVDSPLRISLPDGRTVEARTDAEGRAEVEFDTRDVLWEGALGFSATLTNEQVTRHDSVSLAVHGFAARLRTGRDVYLAGSSFGVDVDTHAPDGEAVSRALTLRVLRLEPGPFGNVAEVEVERHALTTDAASGEASRTLSLARGGSYVLRVEGEDRFSNPIVAQKQVFVSGEEDEIKLRFLCDTSRLNVGERAKLELHNRAADGLALITFEGEGVLDHRVVRLTRGTNPVEFVVDHPHYPNVSVTASMMLGNRFHQADVEFDVERHLTVEVVPARDTYAPGEQARALVRVTDQLGRPVSAELSLAVVDAALFDLYPDRTPALAEVFAAGLRREARMRTVSSCEFSYQGVTRRIAQAVLDEQERVVAEEAWEAERAELGTLLVSSRAAPSGPRSPGPEDFFLGQGQAGDIAFDKEALNDAIGLGGGAGGRFGGRFGGKRKAGAGGEDLVDRSGLDADTAFWIADLVTDARGEAHVEFRVPERSTRWRLTARGVTADTLLGEVEAALVSRSEFFVELRAPVGLTEGDAPRFGARVHNLTGERGECEVSLDVRVAGDDSPRRITRKVVLGEEPVVEVLFDALPALAATEALTVTTSAAFGTREARDAEVLAVRSWGIERTVARSGVLESRSVLELTLPGSAELAGRRLELHVGSGLDRVVIEAALGLDGPYPWRASGSRIAPQVDAASELAGVCAVLEALQRVERVSPAESRELRARANGLVARVVGAQQDNGSWPWMGRSNEDSVETSCRAVVALSRARAVGLSPDPGAVTRGVRWLQAAFRNASQDADELKAMLTHALAVAGEGDFAAANRLHRGRHGLSPAALAYTTLALVEMDREPMAADVANVLVGKADFASDARRSCRWPVVENGAWHRSELEMAALAVQALQRALPTSDAVDAGVEYLMTHRPWFPPAARGAIVEALARFAAETQPQRDNLAVTARIAGTEHALELSAASPSDSLVVALPDDAPRTVRVELELRGRGLPQFAAVLTGFDRDVAAAAREETSLRIRDYRYLAVAPLYAGRAVPTGFGTTRRGKELWRNEVEHLGRGERTTVHLGYRAYFEEGSKRDHDYLVLEVPLPAGARVLEDTLEGTLQGHEVRDGVLTAFVGANRGSGWLRFELLGANAGAYRVLPARLYSAVDAGREGWSEPRALDVLAPGAPNPDAYRPTPDERFHLGSLLFDDGAFDEAHAQLSALMDEFEAQLGETFLKRVANMMLSMSIARDDSDAIVRYFEILKEKDPQLTISFDDVVRVGEAYRDLREFERALLIYRAVVEETYGKDLKVAGTLEEQGEFAGATDTLERLWLEYPDAPSVLQTQLALADLLLTKAPDAAKDASLRRAGRGRAHLTAHGILTLRRFLSMYPDSPLAPEAGLNLVSAHLGLEDNETAAKLAGEFAALYREPRFTDAFLYTQAVAEWYLGRDDEARGLLGRIAEARYPTENGGSAPSENRELALYILGQIHHAQRQLDRAAEFYEQVADQFADAREALAGFRERRLSVEEVTTARPGAPVALELEFKNLEEVELLVYSVDLMTLYLREQNLSNITQVNLAGIAPTLRRTVALEPGAEARELERSLELELADPGAYLVICRGGDLFASGLVLVSELELVVEEDPVSGRLRVQVLDQVTGDYLRDVDVRVVGSADGDFRSGRTDPRGLFVADDVRGRATVIARLGDDRYAFHRGAQPLGEVQQRGAQTLGFDRDADEAGGYLKNVNDLNRFNNDLRQRQLDAEIGKTRAGVQVLQVK